MNKDYHNKLLIYAFDIWCSFRGIISCILIFKILFKDGYYKKLPNCNFPVFTISQVTKKSKPELCIHVTFIHIILLILFAVVIVSVCF